MGHRRWVTVGLVAILAILTGCSRSVVAPPTIPFVAGTEVVATHMPPVDGGESTQEPDGSTLSQEAAATLSSLALIDAYPLYTMRYYGSASAYAPAVQDVPDVPLAAAHGAWACALFATLGDADGMVYGRNFDWEYSPALLLFMNPPDAYASVSMVDIAYLGFDGSKALNLEGRSLDELTSLLEAPFWPFDGMNEMGLVVGMAAVPPGEMQHDPERETVSSLGIMREMLDHAGDVDAAVALFQQYNIDWDGGPPLHYLVADASGRAALVEFYQKEMVVTYNTAPYHLATNFLRASVESTTGQCHRYDLIDQALDEARGRLSVQEGLRLLADASQDITQWSVIYGISTGDVSVAVGQHYDAVHTFSVTGADAP